MSAAPSARRGGGSGRALVALVVLFLLAFTLLRARSGFLAIEADRSAAAAVAERHGLTLAEAFALRDLVGLDADPARWHDAASTFAALRAARGDELAAIAAAGGPVPDGAWAEVRLLPEALPGLRFVAMRDRFAKRAAARP